MSKVQPQQFTASTVQGVSSIALVLVLFLLAFNGSGLMPVLGKR